MANEEQLAILKQGVEVWNKGRKENLHGRLVLGNPILGALLNLFGIDTVGMWIVEKKV